MGAEHGRLHLGGIFLILAITSFLPNVKAAKPVTRQVDNTLVWNMASYGVLSTSSIIEDRFPFVGLRFLGKRVQIFDDTSNPFKYTYSGKCRNIESFYPFCRADWKYLFRKGGQISNSIFISTLLQLLIHLHH